ncbi:MAG: hypothetical protein L0271_03725 [Gemmatimonadetes bacterium]|nr:hypothetical protein [Gemmatimonadota bacterium]
MTEPAPDAVQKRGYRLFAAASVGLGVVAGLHMLGHFAAQRDAGSSAIANAMRAHGIDMGLGLRPSMWDVHTSLSITMSIGLLALALTNLTIIALAGGVPGLIRRLTLLDLVMVGALVALFATFGLLPPLLTLAAVELLFLASLMQQRSGDR